MIAVLLLVGATPAAARTRSNSNRLRRREADLSGTVRDDAGRALSGVRVVLVELGRAVESDAEGRFRFVGVAPGRYTLSLSGPGHAPRALPVHVPGPAIDVVLDPEPLTLDPLTVTVGRGRPSTGATLPTSVVSAEDLTRDRSISLARTLESEPGVRNLSTGLEIGKPMIRGLTGPRVLVLSQGLRLEDYSWSDEDGPTVDPALADRVEVVRGPATVQYGAAAVGGVVNVIPAPLPDAGGGPTIVRAGGDLGFRSNNRELDLLVRTEGATGDWGWRFATTGRKAEALHTPDGELENTGFEALTGEAALVHRGPWGSIQARYERYGGEFRLLEEEGPPAGENGEEPEEEGPERKLSDDRVQLLGTFPVGDLRIETRLQGQQHHLIELEDDPEALREGRFVEVEIFDLTLKTGLGEVLVHHSLGSEVEGTFGLTGMLQGSTGAGLIQLVPDADTRAGGAFALERFERGGWSVEAGLRADLHQMDPEGGPIRAFGAVTGGLGLSRSLGDHAEATVHVGTAWRPPSLFELFAEGPRLGEAHYEIGDPTLDEERSLNLDVGLRAGTERVHGELALFVNRFDPFLFIQPTSRIVDDYPVYEYRSAEARLQGGEIGLRVDATPWLSLEVGGDRVRGTNLDDDEPLPLIPADRFTAGVELHGTGDPGRRSWLGIEGEFVSEPAELNPLDTPVDGYTLLNLQGGLAGRWLGGDVRIDASIRNALDESYRDFLSRYKAFALDPGRDVTLRVEVRP